MILIFLLLWASSAQAMDDDHSDELFTPAHFGSWLKTVEEKEQNVATQAKPNQLSAAIATQNDPQRYPDEHTFHAHRVPNAPKQIFTTMIIRKRLKPNLQNDGQVSSSSSNKKKRKATEVDDDAPTNQEATSSKESIPLPQTTPTIADPAAITVAAPCIVLDCDWCSRFDPTLRGTAAIRQRFQLMDELFHHCIHTHFSVAELLGHVDWALREQRNE